MLSQGRVATTSDLQKRIDNCWLTIDIEFTIPEKDQIIFLASIKTRPFEQYKTFCKHIDLVSEIYIKISCLAVEWSLI
jgi:hypothetical protein